MVDEYDMDLSAAQVNSPQVPGMDHTSDESTYSTVYQSSAYLLMWSTTDYSYLSHEPPAGVPLVCPAEVGKCCLRSRLQRSSRSKDNLQSVLVRTRCDGGANSNRVTRFPPFPAPASRNKYRVYPGRYLLPALYAYS